MTAIFRAFIFISVLCFQHASYASDESADASIFTRALGLVGLTSTLNAVSGPIWSVLEMASSLFPLPFGAHEIIDEGPTLDLSTGQITELAVERVPAELWDRIYLESDRVTCARLSQVNKHLNKWKAKFVKEPEFLIQKGFDKHLFRSLDFSTFNPRPCVLTDEDKERNKQVFFARIAKNYRAPYVDGGLDFGLVHIVFEDYVYRHSDRRTIRALPIERAYEHFSSPHGIAPGVPNELFLTQKGRGREPRGFYQLGNKLFLANTGELSQLTFTKAEGEDRKMHQTEAIKVNASEELILPSVIKDPGAEICYLVQSKENDGTVYRIKCFHLDDFSKKRDLADLGTIPGYPKHFCQFGNKVFIAFEEVGAQGEKSDELSTLVSCDMVGEEAQRCTLAQGRAHSCLFYRQMFKLKKCPHKSFAD